LIEGLETMGALVGLVDLLAKRAARLIASGIRRIRRRQRPDDHAG
jgi:hypothetical protein